MGFVVYILRSAGDGSLYVGMLGLLTMLAVDQRPTVGLIKVSPTAM